MGNAGCGKMGQPSGVGGGGVECGVREDGNFGAAAAVVGMASRGQQRPL